MLLKGVYSFKYRDDLEKFKGTLFYFYSNLNMEFLQ